MEPNVGGFDKTVRTGLGLLFLSVAIATGISNEAFGDLTLPVAVISVVIALSLFVSVLTRRCLGNRLLGINTCE